MEIIFKDVMLDKIVFNRENNAVCFEFYSYTGKDIGKIICENVFKLDLNQSIMFDEDLLPCLVLDVTSGQLRNEEIVEYFSKLNYSFRNTEEPMVPPSELYWYFEIAGGPIVIQVICGNIVKILFED